MCQKMLYFQRMGCCLVPGTTRHSRQGMGMLVDELDTVNFFAAPSEKGYAHGHDKVTMNEDFFFDIETAQFSIPHELVK